MNKYYVYTHIDLNGIPFYVGKGSGNRAWNKNRQKKWKNIAKNGYEVIIQEKNMLKDDAFKLEEELTIKYGRRCNNSGTLINISIGKKHSEFTKEKLRITSTGKKHSESTKEKMRINHWKSKKVINKLNGKIYENIRAAYLVACRNNDFKFTYQCFNDLLKIKHIKTKHELLSYEMYKM